MNYGHHPGSIRQENWYPRCQDSEIGGRDLKILQQLTAF